MLHTHYVCTTVAVEYRGQQKSAINGKYEIQHTYVHYFVSGSKMMRTLSSNLSPPFNVIGATTLEFISFKVDVEAIQILEAMAPAQLTMLATGRA